ncbi:globin [Microbacterium cremeum]|uniref:globin n=1 Tax=Microbacterium cremeum TaxID=2782169 RepID=UPI00235408CF|nr:globin [Microbacterium cremeum]
MSDNATPSGTPAGAEPMSFYDEVGGYATFERLVDAFYRGVADDEVLRPMYPEEDLGPAKERLTLFLVQYWGGPTTYSEQRGHPRLRMRHAPFHVNPDARDRWLAHMRVAVDELDLPPLHETTLWDYLQRAAFAMVNTFEPSGIGPAAAGRDATAGSAQPGAPRSSLPVTAASPADPEQPR